MNTSRILEQCARLKAQIEWPLVGSHRDSITTIYCLGVTIGPTWVESRSPRHESGILSGEAIRVQLPWSSDWRSGTGNWNLVRLDYHAGMAFLDSKGIPCSFNGGVMNLYGIRYAKLLQFSAGNIGNTGNVEKSIFRKGFSEPTKVEELPWMIDQIAKRSSSFWSGHALVEFPTGQVGVHFRFTLRTRDIWYRWKSVNGLIDGSLLKFPIVSQ